MINPLSLSFIVLHSVMPPKRCGKSAVPKVPRIRRVRITYPVPVDSVLMTGPISKAIRQHGGNRPDGCLSDRGDHGFPLSRMEKNLQLAQSGDTSPPIDVCIIRNRGRSYYQVIDGRHRFACAVIVGRSHVMVRTTKTVNM